jgi:predicted small secreted protein
MKRLSIVLVLIALALAACGSSASDGDGSPVKESTGNPLTDGVPSCSDLKAGADMADFEQGCTNGDTIVASLGYDCGKSGDKLVYVAPDEDAGEIYYGVPGKKAEKGKTADDFWAFMKSC